MVYKRDQKKQVVSLLLQLCKPWQLPIGLHIIGCRTNHTRRMDSLAPYLHLDLQHLYSDGADTHAPGLLRIFSACALHIAQDLERFSFPAA